jgi:hypothetical protein
MRHAGGGAPRAKTIYALVLVLLLVVLVGWYCYFVGAKMERDALLRGHPELVARWEVDEIIEVCAKSKCAALYPHPSAPFFFEFYFYFDKFIYYFISYEIHKINPGWKRSGCWGCARAWRRTTSARSRRSRWTT